ncbi:MAG: hypothetical protein AAF632_09745 [Bacteroidota bacterium]
MKQISKKLVLYSLILIFGSSCAPKLKSTITNPQEHLATNDFVLVLGIQDPFENDGIKVGTIRASDNGLSTNCSYYEVLELLKGIARENGANVMKITEHKTPGLKSTCDRVTADIFRVPDFRKHEQEIQWSSDRKLTWADFKGMPTIVSNSNVGAQSYCGFGFQSNYVTAFSKAKIFVHATFDCNLSWVRDDQKHRDELLEHEQFHFNLSEVYARKLRKRFSETQLSAGNINTEANTIFKQIYAEYLNRQELYDFETKHGLDKGQQKRWQFTIRQELLDLQSFEQ